MRKTLVLLESRLSQAMNKYYNVGAPYGNLDEWMLSRVFVLDGDTTRVYNGEDLIKVCRPSIYSPTEGSAFFFLSDLK